MKRLKFRNKYHKFRATNSMLFIIFLTFLILLITLKILDFKTTITIADFADKQLARQDQRLEELIRENEDLKDKIDISKTIQTPPQVKKLSKYYIQKYFPKEEWVRAEKITTCESNMNPDVVNTKNKNGSVDRGLWQINSVHAKRFTEMFKIAWEIGAHDLDLSTKYALYLYKHQKWQPWTCAKLI